MHSAPTCPHFSKPSPPLPSPWWLLPCSQNPLPYPLLLEVFLGAVSFLLSPHQPVAGNSSAESLSLPHPRVSSTQLGTHGEPEWGT